MQPYYKWRPIYHTGIHSKIVRLTVTNGGPFMVDLWPHGQLHLRESDLLWKITHYTNCATGRSHESTVWPKKKLRLWLQIQILKFLLTIKLTRGSSRHIWRVRVFQPIFQDISCHVILESFQRIFLGTDSFLVSWEYLWSTINTVRIIIYGSTAWTQIQVPLNFYLISWGILCTKS
jgi:hypothetical protein